MLSQVTHKVLSQGDRTRYLMHIVCSPVWHAEQYRNVDKLMEKRRENCWKRSGNVLDSVKRWTANAARTARSTGVEDTLKGILHISRLVDDLESGLRVKRAKRARWLRTLCALHNQVRTCWQQVCSTEKAFEHALQLGLFWSGNFCHHWTTGWIRKSWTNRNFHAV